MGMSREFSFYGCANLTAVTIPACVRRIGPGAFEGCTNLTSVHIPDGVTQICGGVFSGCANLVPSGQFDGTREQGI